MTAAELKNDDTIYVERQHTNTNVNSFFMNCWLLRCGAPEGMKKIYKYQGSQRVDPSLGCTRKQSPSDLKRRIKDADYSSDAPLTSRTLGARTCAVRGPNKSSVRKLVSKRISLWAEHNEDECERKWTVHQKVSSDKTLTKRRLIVLAH